MCHDQIWETGLERVRLRPQTLVVLACLARCADKVVTKELIPQGFSEALLEFISDK